MECPFKPQFMRTLPPSLLFSTDVRQPELWDLRLALLKELDSPFKPYPRAEIVESPFLQLKLAKLDSRDQDTWIAEALLRLAFIEATLSG